MKYIPVLAVLEAVALKSATPWPILGFSEGVTVVSVASTKLGKQRNKANKIRRTKPPSKKPTFPK